MCRVLNIWEFRIFVNFRKNDSVSNVIRMQLRMCSEQDFKYARFLHMQIFHEVLNMPMAE